MELSRKKRNRNFPDQTKAQDGRLLILTLVLGLRHLKGKAVELLLEISLPIPWDLVETNTIEISQIEQRHKTADS